jgi:hypothetical protein
MVCVIQFCWLTAYLYDIYHCPLLCMQWKTPDDRQGNCPKHVQFYSKNKFEKLTHLVGFIIRIYHDARSAEREIPKGIIFDVVGLILVVEKLIHFCVTLNSLRARLKANYFFISWLHCAGYDDPVPPSVVSLSVIVENGHVTISLVYRDA